MPMKLISRRHAAAVIGAGALSACVCPAPPPVDANAIIVAPAAASPPGNDANAGTLAAPVASLARAQTLCRANGLSKTVYLRAGTYVWTSGQAAPLVLTAADNGETWSYYPPDGYNSAILDYTNQVFTQSGHADGGFSQLGVNGGSCIVGQGVSNLTIDGLTFQNIPAQGIMFYGGASGFGFAPNTNNTLNPSGDVIQNCIFRNGGYAAFPTTFPGNDGQNVTSGAGIFSTETPFIWFQGSGQFGGTVQHCAFITHAATPIVCQVNNILVQNCYLGDSNKASFDSGVLYTQNTSGVTWRYNYIRDYKSYTPTQSVAGDIWPIYFDNNSNNVTCQFNIVAGAPTDTSAVAATTFVQYGVGTGSNQNVAFNIFDMGNVPHIPFEQNSTGTGNVFASNAIISKFADGPSYAFTGVPVFNFSNASPAMTVGPNLFFNYGGGLIYTTSHNNAPAYNDSSPQNVDPQLSGSLWSYMPAPASPLFSAPLNWPALPADWGQPGFWGPPGFTIPTTGTGSVPSYL
jgi:hypothetical protein